MQTTGARAISTEHLRLPDVTSRAASYSRESGAPFALYSSNRNGGSNLSRDQVASHISDVVVAAIHLGYIKNMKLIRLIGFTAVEKALFKSALNKSITYDFSTYQDSGPCGGVTTKLSRGSLYCSPLPLNHHSDFSILPSLLLPILTNPPLTRQPSLPKSTKSPLRWRWRTSLTIRLMRLLTRLTTSLISKAACLKQLCQRENP